MESEEIKAHIQQAISETRAEYKAISTGPKWKVITVIAILCAVLVYLGWMLWDIKHPGAKAGDVQISVPEPKVIQNMQRERIITNTYYIKDKEAAVKELGLPASEASNPKESLLTAAKVEANRYGATAVVFVNRSTGRPRSDVKYNLSPIFAFKRDIAYGVGAGIGTQGQTLAGRIRLDVAQIKEVTISPEVELNYADRRDKQIEGKFLIWAEYRP